MKKFNYQDWEIETEIEVGHDDFVYGNYFDWDMFRKENEKELLNYFDVYLPWDEDITMPDYACFMNQELHTNTSIIDDLDSLLSITDYSDIVSDIIIHFPSRDDVSDDVISNIFDYCGVPAGIQYEFELPEGLQYWREQLWDLENEYENYSNYPLKLQDYMSKIENIKLLVQNATDDLIRKSLILSSFIITESLLKSVIVNKIPKEEMSEFSKKIVEEQINKKLRGSVDDRNKLFKDLFNVKAPIQKWVNLRNSLAHDIEEVCVENNDISYINLKDGKLYKEKIDTLFIEQVNFSDQLKKIIDQN